MTALRISIAGAALFMKCGGAAAAGPCSAQVEELSSVVGWKDAGGAG